MSGIKNLQRNAAGILLRISFSCYVFRLKKFGYSTQRRKDAETQRQRRTREIALCCILNLTHPNQFQFLRCAFAALRLCVESSILDLSDPVMNNTPSPKV